MPIGVIINCLSVFLGGLIGALLGKKIPSKLRKALPPIFGVASMAMGIGAIIKMHTLPAVVLALILGSGIGILIGIENLLEKSVLKIQKPMERLLAKNKGTNLIETDTSLIETGISSIENKTPQQDDFIEKFVSLVVLFCASGTGIFGALTEGMTGDYTVLLAKSMLDFFSAAIFAASLGYLVAAIALPQAAIMLLLFFSATFIMPLTTPQMLADFTALGGIIMLATGFRISGIRNFPVANMLPAFILVMPLSYLWSVLPI
ncbi:MAG: DUF554 domain-containing protein [Clostridia bacterium]